MRSSLGLSLATVLGLATAAIAGPPAGALFTTLADGSRVNANIYEAKTDVYLDGGPGNGAPIGAAALDAGDYYFQVTDPSGKVLLSQDGIAARTFHVNAQGIIDQVATHVTGIDQDHGALTVQLMPYANTPNNGGEYKVWATPKARYAAGQGTFGFIGKFSKTDNFKVRHPDTPDCGCGCGCD
jgi:hypothetical protein